ncbi:MAG: hypothetical protein M1837_001949 [Sclerophora amabilis]|nr:MAG: hypothetical protein M1837_001949 [Sclerophora amabilis]
MMTLVDNEEIKAMLHGFEAMTVELSRLSHKVSDLEGKLLRYRNGYQAKDSTLSARNRKSSTADNRSISSRATGSSSHSQSNNVPGKVELRSVIQRGQDARELISRSMAQDSRSLEGPKSAVSQQGISPGTSKGSFRQKDETVGDKHDLEELEKNFTTNGRPGELGCPFAIPKAENANQNASHSTPFRISNTNANHVDPIEADLNGDNLTSPPPSANGSTSKCPIRFLEKHSAEEVADYFEKHKNEIPRSHEVCVKRYQRNAVSIRQLDAKYGNLVSMIQGLGMKHQPLLTEKDAEANAVAEEEKNANERVEKWAGKVDESVRDAQKDDTLVGHGDEERQGHFDRPLKEIRVGESPSRPWGISVPLPDEAPATHPPNGTSQPDHPAAESAMLPEADQPIKTEPEKIRNGCPFGFDKRNLETAAEPGEPKGRPLPSVSPLHQSPTFVQPPAARSSQQQTPPQMVFTGPVFIGYPVEQVAALWQNGLDTGAHHDKQQ